MANSRDFTGKNRKFTGTKGITISKGTTGERVGSESGELRFNTTTELMEYYDGNQWKSIDAPPSISSVTTSDSVGSSTVLNADGSTLYTITINGSNFGIGATVKFTGTTGTDYSANNTTRVSSSQITCTTRSTMGTTDDPYIVTVTNASGLTATLADAFSYNAAPVFVNASGQLGQVYNTEVISGSTFNASATDAEGNTITYSIISGSLPGSGLSISSSTGYITGTLSGSPSLGNYPFVVRAATTEGNIERQFSIQVRAIPPYAIDFLVIAGGGGGGGGTYHGGGGGAGGFRTSTQTPNLGVTITTTVGDGGGGAGGGSTGGNGSDSSISGTSLSTITSTGGGGGAASGNSGNSGGSGGGQGGNGSGGSAAGNSPATSPSQGNNGGGGAGSAAPRYGGGGGGGAGAVGGTGTSGQGGDGGSGTASSITGSSVTRAGGGGGSSYQSGPSGAGGAGGGGAGSTGRGSNGDANTGGGGGGSERNDPTGGNGGKGVVILSLPTSRYSGTTTGSPTVTTSGSNTILTFTGSGSYTT